MKHEPVSMECCKQVIGEKCLDKWIKSSNKNNDRCPHCRQKLFEQDHAANDEDVEHPYDVDSNNGENGNEATMPPGDSDALAHRPGIHSLYPNVDVEALWYTIHRRPGLDLELWKEVQANFDALDTPDRMRQWHHILNIIRRVLENIHPPNQYAHGELFLSYHNRVPGALVALLDCLRDLEDAAGPGVPLTQRQGQAYRAAGPIFDCIYLMVKCAGAIQPRGIVDLDSGLFNEVVGDQGGCWSGLYDRLEIRDRFLWDRVFGDAMRLCRDADAAALRLLSAMLLCQPVDTIKRALVGWEGSAFSWSNGEWRDYNNCLLVTNNLRRDLGEIDSHMRLNYVTDIDLLSRWREPRLTII
ncbi:hypothetical protein SLS60_006769 [Paraconiothyrium brasiliense]|uniref:RING-type domain-containing protein n=1 Tax=Paraconiothyrium brasiliense TaxID=300254 RepID=A0ABR3R7G8_9PLEO